MTSLAFTPGIHRGIPAEAYHASPFISNSVLKEFRAFGPYKWHRLRDNPQPKETTPAMERGTLLHLAVFEPYEFAAGVSHHCKPAGMKFTTKEGKTWQEEHAGLPILSIEEVAHIDGAACAVRQNPFIGSILSAKGQAESTILATHARTGLKLKARMDWLTEDSEGRPWILDLKSIEKLDKAAFSCRDFGYDVQSVFYKDMLDRVGVASAQFVFCFVELTPPYDIRLVQISPESEMAAGALYESELDRIAECQASGNWPRKYPSVESLTVPRRWVAQQEEVFEV